MKQGINIELCLVIWKTRKKKYKTETLLSKGLHYSAIVQGEGAGKTRRDLRSPGAHTVTKAG